MQSQLQEYNDTDTPETTSALTPASNSKLSPTEQAFKKGQWIVSLIFVFFTQLFNYPGRLFNTYKQLITSIALASGLVFGAIIALRVVLAALDAVNDIPLIAPTFELIGIGYLVWFVNRYLLKPSNRQDLSQKVQGFLSQQTEDSNS